MLTFASSLPRLVNPMAENHDDASPKCWKQIAGELATEHNPAKVIELAAELVQALDERQQPSEVPAKPRS